MRVTVHAFLGRPNDSTLQAFQDEADIVEQFTICTAVDHAAERAAFGSYRSSCARTAGCIRLGGLEHSC